MNRQKHSCNTRGQALTELILVFPIFFVVLLAVVQFSLLYTAFQFVQYASFAAARAAVVRPCSCFHPDDSAASNFSPAVFTAAVLSTLGIAPSQPLFGSTPPYPWMPALPDSDQVAELDFQSIDPSIPEYKYINAAYLTSVQRVRWEDAEEAWLPFAGNCAVPFSTQQNVPVPGEDVTLEVTFLYPMSIPLVNRVVYGVFVNFGSLASDPAHPRFLDLDEIEGEVMVKPTQVLPEITSSSMGEAIERISLEFGYAAPSLARADFLAAQLADRAWYPLPVRARCTLTVEGALNPLFGP
ncbi:MAG: TadE family protein [bacterium]